ncbi:MAG: alpha/beta fold hydrolase, partial [Beijerinckiaceae bacterium]
RAQPVRDSAPSPPGLGASDAPPASITTPDDLAYFYLDLLEQMDLTDVIVAGASFGGWIAAEIATKDCTRLAGLVLIDAFGIRPGDRNTRDIQDIFGIPDEGLAAMAYKSPPEGAGNLRAINDDDELRRRLRGRDGLAYYGWQPYMHNPRLQSRLHRVKVPSLVLWGDSDAITSPAYGRTYAEAIPGATFELIGNAGHLAHIEQPQDVAARIAGFAAAVSGQAADRAEAAPA